MNTKDRISRMDRNEKTDAVAAATGKLRMKNSDANSSGDSSSGGSSHHSSNNSPNNRHRHSNNNNNNNNNNNDNNNNNNNKNNNTNNSDNDRQRQHHRHHHHHHHRHHYRHDIIAHRDHHRHHISHRRGSRSPLTASTTMGTKNRQFPATSGGGGGGGAAGHTVKTESSKKGYGNSTASTTVTGTATTTTKTTMVNRKKSKPLPVNELDLSVLSQKEQESKLGNRGKDGIQNRYEKVPYRQRFGMMDRRGFWNSRSKIDYRRTPMFPPRRGIGGSDVIDQRIQHGRNNRQTYQRSIEQERSKGDDEKPVMNLFDPCKVPTGRSYFTHDDRTTKPPRNTRPRFSGSGDNDWQSLPVGWRNVRKVRRNDGAIRDDGYGPSDKKRIEKNPSDGVWKHDMFECEESEAV